MKGKNKNEKEDRKGKSEWENLCLGCVYVCVWVSALSDLLSAFRPRSLFVPLDPGLLRFRNTLQECGIALYPKQDPLFYSPPNET